MQIKKKRIFILSLVCALMCPGNVFAKESLMIPVTETDRQGSLTIRLEDTKEDLSKVDVPVSIVKVADVEDGAFLLCEDFVTSEVELAKIKTANEMEEAAKKILQKVRKSDQIYYTDEDGTVVISNLSVGVYLVFAQAFAGYETILPSLVSIPSWNEEEGKMDYDVEMMPKHEAKLEKETPPTGDQNHLHSYILLSAGAVFTAAGWICVKHRKMKVYKKNKIC